MNRSKALFRIVAAFALLEICCVPGSAADLDVSGAVKLATEYLAAGAAARAGLAERLDSYSGEIAAVMAALRAAQRNRWDQPTPSGAMEEFSLPVYRTAEFKELFPKSRLFCFPPAGFNPDEPSGLLIYRHGGGAGNSAATGGFRIDPDRIVIGGFSMGGTGAWNHAQRLGDRICAGLVIAGGWWWTRFEPYRGTPLFLIFGQYDGYVEQMAHYHDGVTIPHELRTPRCLAEANSLGLAHARLKEAGVRHVLKWHQGGHTLLNEAAPAVRIFWDWVQGLECESDSGSTARDTLIR